MIKRVLKLVTICLLLLDTAFALQQRIYPTKQMVAFLEFLGHIPKDVSVGGMGYSVQLNGRTVMFPQGWDKGYIPHFIPLKKEGELYKILLTVPLELKGRSDELILNSHNGAVKMIKLREKIDAVVTKKVEPSGTNFIFYPDEAPKIAFSLTSDKDLSLDADLMFYAVSLADNKGGDDWQPGLRFVPVQILEQRKLKIKLSKGENKFEFLAPTKQYGTISAFLVLYQGEKIFPLHILNYAVVPKRGRGFYEEGLLMASCGEARFIPALKKIGIDWVRYEVGWDSFEPEKGKFKWDRHDKFMGECRREGICVMTLTEGAPEWAKPKGDFVDIPYKNFTIKLDWSPGREHYEDWKNAWIEFLKRYRDVVRALNVWNEPWEGGGISGWKSTGEHYRELLRRVREARDCVDPSVKIVAADSSHNTDWKIFAAGMEKDIDVISIHYEFPVQSSYSFAMAKFYGKEVWDTETWLTWMGDASCLRGMLHEIILGAKKISPFVTNLIFDENGFPNTSVGWASALARFLNGKKFAGLAHPERPPFVFLFQGKGENVAVATTTLWTHYQYRHNYPWGQFSDCSVIIQLPAKAKVRVYDIYGNEVHFRASGGKIEIPVDSSPKYITSDMKFEVFKELLSKAIYRNLPPVEIRIHQIGRPLEQKPQLRVDLLNVHPFAIKGEMEVIAEGLEFEKSKIRFELSSLEKRPFYLRITGKRREMVSYPCKVIVRTKEGTSVWEEGLVVAVVKRGKITVDGDLSDWEKIGAIPIILSKVSGAVEALKAWFPWKEFSQKVGDFAGEVAFAYDEENLYVMGRIKDGTRDLLPSLLSGRNLHKFQNPPGDYVYYEAGPFPGGSGDVFKLSLSPLSENYDEKYDVFPPNLPLQRLGHYISAVYQYLLYPIKEGGGEIMRVRTPDFFYLHPLPINYEFLAKACRVNGSKIEVRLLDEGYIFEAQVPWSELREIKPEVGKRIKMSFVIQNGNMGNTLEFSRGKSLCGINTLDFEPGWGAKYTAETEFEFVE